MISKCVPIAQRTSGVSIAKTNLLMLFRKIALHYENHTNRTDMICGQGTAFKYYNRRYIQRYQMCVKRLPNTTTDMRAVARSEARIIVELQSLGMQSAMLSDR
jgi:hypothetical protein